MYGVRQMRAQIQEAVDELEKLLKAEEAADTPCMHAVEEPPTGAAPAADVGHRCNTVRCCQHGMSLGGTGKVSTVLAMDGKNFTGS